ncbi:MAG TPA: phosphomannomutase/phosphoglucomutase [Porticoccaceae bacterium]|nr:phosphomannomutase/phosphoglucomutase [Porticoccaceae bacterium]
MNLPGLSRVPELVRNPLVVGALLVLLAVPGPLGSWLHQHLIAGPQGEAAATAARTAADAAAATVADALARWRIRLSGFAADPEARAGLSAPPGPAETALREGFPQARDARVITAAGQLAATDFVGQQLVRAVLGGQPFAAAARRDGGAQDEWEVLLAVPILIAGKPGGAALVSVAAQALAEEMKFDPAQGRLTLFQQVPGMPQQAFLALGTASNAPPVNAPVANVPDWQASLRVAPALTAAQQPATALAALVRLGPWLLALGLLALACRRAWARLPPPAPAAPRTEPARRTALVVERESAIAAANPAPAAPRASEPAAASPAPAGPTEADARFPRSVFRGYDIRGAADSEITVEFAGALGRTLGTLVRERGASRVVVARDGRVSSPPLAEALVDGLMASGCVVVNIGLVPTPLLGFAAQRLPDIGAAVMVTASHNPAGDNGFKITLGGTPLQGGPLFEVHRRMAAQRWQEGTGTGEALDIQDDYLRAVVANIAGPLSQKVVVDCGNGAAGEIAPRVLDALGCTPIPLYCDIDGTFPNHPPDPVCAANLRDLRKAVIATGADLGIALDGDGDRLVAVSGSGRIVWPDELMLLFVRDVLTTHPGAAIVYDVKSTRRLATLIGNYGGHPVMHRTGHSHIRTKTAELDAPLGGEFSGHLFFRDRWLGTDDALYAAARLLELLARREQSLDAVLATLETTVASDEMRLPVPEHDKFALIERARTAAMFADARIIDIDGLRVEFAEGWGLLRASNTESVITLRFEAVDQTQLDAIRARFQALLDTVAPDYGLTV